MVWLTQMCLAKHSALSGGWHFWKVHLTQFCSTIKSLWLCVLVYHQKTEKKVVSFRSFDELTGKCIQAIVSTELCQE